MLTDSIAKLASKHGIKPLKKFGQNFLFDETLCDKIVKSSGLSAGENVLEIGPGTAGLTRSILKANPKKLKCIERDDRCISLLAEVASHYPSLEILHEDALRTDIKNLFSNGKFRIISNLPYNIGTKLLISWLGSLSHITSMTLMLQKEVVDRIVAKPGSKDYGRLSVIVKLTCNAKKLFDVSPKAFYPAPKVWSSIVHLVPNDNPLDKALISQIEKVTNLAFSGRRKMIKSSLKTISPTIEILFKDLDINPSMRAEELTPAQYLAIAKLTSL